MDPDRTAPIGRVCSGSTLFAYILNSLVILGNYLQQTTSADDISDALNAFFLGASRVKRNTEFSAYLKSLVPHLGPNCERPLSNMTAQFDNTIILYWL